MSIAYYKQKIKDTTGFYDKKDIVLSVLIILVGLGSFCFGRLSVSEAQKPSITLEYQAPVGAPLAAFEDLQKTVSVVNEGPGSSGGTVVGSKNGTKYHLPWCSGAKRIKEENKIWFASIQEAEKAGYTKAGNCK